jgi:hypothetical protein
METKMKSSDGGKGSSPRPFSVTQEEYDNRWDAIFSRDLPKETEEKVTRYNEETQEVKKNDN